MNGNMPMTGNMTPEMMDAFMGMEDFNTREKMLARQQALTDQLRAGSTRPGRMDWASQLGRAVQGVGGAYGGMKTGEEQKALGLSKRDFIDNWRRMNIPQRTPMADEMVPGQYSTVNRQYGG